MPGVGVAPFRRFALKEFALAAGNPGAFALTVSGLPENSGGTFVCDLAFAEFTTIAVLPFVFSALWQAKLKNVAATVQSHSSKVFLNIKILTGERIQRFSDADLTSERCLFTLTDLFECFPKSAKTAW